MPRIGFSTFCLYPAHDALGSVRYAAARGHEVVELWLTPGRCRWEALGASELREIRRVAEAIGLQLTVHGQTYDNNLASHDAEHRAASVRQIRGSINLAAEVGATLVVVHPGTVSALKAADKWSAHPAVAKMAGRLRREAAQYAAESIRACAEHARRRGLRLSLENLCHEAHSVAPTFEEFAALVSAVGDPDMNVTLDTGHAALTGGSPAMIEVLGPRIAHVHMNDNSCERSDHWELGRGKIDFLPLRNFLLDLLGTIVYEVRDLDDPEGALERSHAYLRALLKGRRP